MGDDLHGRWKQSLDGYLRRITNSVAFVNREMAVHRQVEFAFALFRDGKQISKTHSTRHAVIIEAHERNIVAPTTADFRTDDSHNWLPDEYEISKAT